MSSSYNHEHPSLAESIIERWGSEPRSIVGMLPAPQPPHEVTQARTGIADPQWLALAERHLWLLTMWLFVSTAAIALVVYEARDWSRAWAPAVASLVLGASALAGLALHRRCRRATSDRHTRNGRGATRYH